MTKVRVHELAKELNKQNKDVIDFLRSKNMEVNSHMSSLSDEQIAMVKAEFGPKDEQPKKKNIVQVFRPQNSQNNRQQGNRPQGQRPEGQRPEKREGQGQRPEGQKFERREGQGQRP
jgi:translation initiation factor IF-2